MCTSQVCDQLLKGTTSRIQASAACFHHSQGSVRHINVGCHWWTGCGPPTISIDMLQYLEATNIQEDGDIERKTPLCYQVQHRF
jgi:hypothetical protein